MMTNLITLHEAMVIALIGLPFRQGTFEEISGIISKRGLFPNRKGNISLTKQIQLRAFQSKGRYYHLFEKVDRETIKLKNS